MVRTHHGGLPTAALHGRSPPPYIPVTGDLNLLQKNGQNPWFTARIQTKTLLRNASPLYHPPSQPHIMMAACPLPLSYTLANDDPPLPSTPTQPLRQNLRDRCLFRNDGWTKLEAVQLADKLEVKREMVKADWECWKKKEKQFK
jgi:hypothetical protein